MFLNERLACANPSSSFGDSFAVQVFPTLVNRYAVMRHPYVQSRFSMLFGNQLMTDQLQKTIDIFHRVGGMAGGFLIKHPSEFSTNNYVEVPTNHDHELEQVGVATYYLTIWYDTQNAAQPRRRIKKPIADTLQLSIFDGVNYTPLAAYTLDPDSGLITLDTPLTSFETLYGGAYFDIPVQFETDLSDVVFQGAEIMSTSINLIETLNPEDL